MRRLGKQYFVLFLIYFKDLSYILQLSKNVKFLAKLYLMGTNRCNICENYFNLCPVLFCTAKSVYPKLYCAVFVLSVQYNCTVL